ncbi:MAG: tyrosine-type recombinase/integrase [Desulfobacterales bacterium]|jgi:integrase|nr:tyrosine-type recombinase/integrase [Desulfobacterales bacterium]
MPYKDGKGWRAVVKKDGKRIAQRLFALRRDAVDWEIQQKKALKKAEKRQRAGLDLLSFCSKYLIYAERYTKKVYDEKKNVCKRIMKIWGPETFVDDISTEMAESFLLDQKEERSANASNKDRKNLMVMWQKGVLTWGVEQNPFTLTERYAHDRANQYTPPSQDVLQVLLVATRKERVLLYAYIQTGARRSELYRWNWIDDINFEKRQYRLGTRKTRDGSMRHEWFPMSDELYDELWWWWQNRPIKDSPWVFTDDQPGPHYGKQYKERRRFMAGLCKRAGVKQYGFHALRRFCASCLADAGKSTNAIRRFLRHQNVRTTEIYIQNINDDMQDVADALTTKNLFPVPGSGTPENEEGVNQSG